MLKYNILKNENSFLCQVVGWLEIQFLR